MSKMYIHEYIYIYTYNKYPSLYFTAIKILCFNSFSLNFRSSDTCKLLFSNY